MKIWAIDDHLLIMEGYSIIFEGFEEFDLERKFTNPLHALGAIDGDEGPDVILLDIHIPGFEDGVTLCKKIKSKDSTIRILGVSTYDDISIIRAFMKAGGDGFVLKNTDFGLFRDAVRSVAKGQRYLEPNLEKSLLAQSLYNERSNYYKPKLTTRELEVLERIIQGMTTQEIAEDLCLGSKTIESHRTQLMSKFAVSNATSLVREAIKKGFG